MSVACALLTPCACQVLDGPDTGNFIVLFKSPRSANLAANSTVYPHTGRVEAFKVQPAPNPEDVLWPVRICGAAALPVCWPAALLVGEPPWLVYSIHWQPLMDISGLLHDLFLQSGLGPPALCVSVCYVLALLLYSAC